MSSTRGKSHKKKQKKSQENEQESKHTTLIDSSINNVSSSFTSSKNITQTISNHSAKPSDRELDESDHAEEKIIEDNNKAIGHLSTPLQSSFNALSPEPIEGALYFSKGELRKYLSDKIESKNVLSSAEENEIKKAIDILEEHVIRINAKNELRNHMLIGHMKGIAINIKIKKNSIVQDASLEDIEKQCVELQQDSLRYIKFISGKAAKLAYAGDSVRAIEVYKEALKYSIKICGIDHVETLKLRLEYQTAISRHTRSDESIENVILSISKLKNCLSEQNLPAYNNDIKKSIAIAQYHLAQHYWAAGNWDDALNYINESSAYRREYGANEEEMDRIRYFHARLLMNKSHAQKQALELLKECYVFRSSKDKLNSLLIPLLRDIITIAQGPEKLSFLLKLLEVQRNAHASERDIINTQLNILTDSRYGISDTEFRSILEDIELRLNQISIGGEDKEVGRNYVEVAKIRINSFLPEEWSHTRKLGYHQQTLKLIQKAELHLFKGVPTAGVIDRGDYKGFLNSLKEKCGYLINFYETERSKPSIRKALIHPEDKAVVSILETKNEGMSGSTGTTTLEGLKILSDFSSEVQYSIVEEVDRDITLGEFEELSEQGTINPYRLRTAQGGINKEFRDGKSLDETKSRLVANPHYTNKIPPIEIGIYKGKIYSFDTRRLIVHKQAKEENPNVYIRYRKIYGAELQERIDRIYSSRPWNGHVTALRYGGKNSASEPYINPPLRSQLEKTVQKEFKSFPSERKGADANGFPELRQKAKKIYFYFKMKANNGSKIAKKILREAKNIDKSKGEDAAHAFLIQQKADASDRKVVTVYDTKNNEAVKPTTIQRNIENAISVTQSQSTLEVVDQSTSPFSILQPISSHNENNKKKSIISQTKASPDSNITSIEDHSSTSFVTNNLKIPHVKGDMDRYNNKSHNINTMTSKKKANSYPDLTTLEKIVANHSLSPSEQREFKERWYVLPQERQTAATINHLITYHEIARSDRVSTSYSSMNKETMQFLTEFKDSLTSQAILTTSENKKIPNVLRAKFLRNNIVQEPSNKQDIEQLNNLKGIIKDCSLNIQANEKELEECLNILQEKATYENQREIASFLQLLIDEANGLGVEIYEKKIKVLQSCIDAILIKTHQKGLVT